MKALVFYGIKDIRYEPDWPEPQDPGPGEVTVAASWCGICGTDMEDYEYGAIIPREKPHPLSGRMAPMVLGHEYAGTIAKVGQGVENVRVGERVAVECVRTCMQCHWCQIGEYAICEQMVSVGQQDDGGMAEFFNIPAHNCIPIPDSLDDGVASLAEPLAVMVRGVIRGRVQAGETVAVVGAGPIGLMGIAAARAVGARQVIAVARGGRRGEVAAEMGANYVLNTREAGWREVYYDLTDGLGAEVVIDAAGNLEAMKMAVELTARHGRCVINSVVDDDIPVPCLDFLLGEKELIATVAHSADKEFKWAVEMLADGRVDPASMITSRIHLKDAVSQGFDMLKTDRNQIKILVTPHEGWVS